MAVTFDAVSVNTGTGASITVNHTTASGTDRLMLIWVFIDSGSAFAPAVSVDSVSAGAAIVEVETNRYLALFSFLAPTVGANVIDVTSLPGGGAEGVIVETFSGVDQATPLGTPSTANAGTSSPPVTINISSVTGDMVVDAIHLNNISNALAASGSNQTERHNAENGSSTFGASTKPGETTAAMTWGWSSSVAYAQVAVNIAASAGTRRFILVRP